MLELLKDKKTGPRAPFTFTEAWVYSVAQKAELPATPCQERKHRWKEESQNWGFYISIALWCSALAPLPPRSKLTPPVSLHPSKCLNLPPGVLLPVFLATFERSSASPASVREWWWSMLKGEQGQPNGNFINWKSYMKLSKWASKRKLRMG